MSLNDTFIKQAKHSGKPAGDKHSDGGGLYLHIKAAGKYWRMAYRFGGKQKTLALGVYPAVTLAQARKRRDEAKAQLAEGLDPGIVKHAAKIARAEAGEHTFEAVAREYHGVKKSGWSEKYAAKWLRGLELHIFPYVGKLRLSDIKATMLLTALRKIENRGNRDAAHTQAQNSAVVFRYGMHTGRCDFNPADGLSSALQPVIVKHMAALLKPREVGQLLRSFDACNSRPLTKFALQLSAYLFQRPGNIRLMEWAWVDLDIGMMTIPSADMKRTVPQKLNGRPHLVPLARQTIEILREIQPLTGHRKFVFPATRGQGRPMSNGTVNAALHRIGYTSDQMTPHGFRAMAQTLILEQLSGIHADVIEAQLAHGKSGPLGAAYDRAEYMDQRRSMMQVWADYLDRLKAGADVIPFKSAGLR